MQPDNEPDSEELICRLLGVMPERWISILLSRIQRVYADTGYGEVVIIIHGGRVVQVNGTVKEK